MQTVSTPIVRFARQRFKHSPLVTAPVRSTARLPLGPGPRHPFWLWRPSQRCCRQRWHDQRAVMHMRRGHCRHQHSVLRWPPPPWLRCCCCCCCWRVAVPAARDPFRRSMTGRQTSRAWTATRAARTDGIGSGAIRVHTMCQSCLQRRGSSVTLMRLSSLDMWRTKYTSVWIDPLGFLATSGRPLKRVVQRNSSVFAHANSQATTASIAILGSAFQKGLASTIAGKVVVGLVAPRA
mmetsp:Transcript_90175/g.250515  ORF Transcript_90175/g.250515 Transcript_90175/m.250515 type:complete len:236 (+) Transcript_90175:342-1049(+)